MKKWLKSGAVILLFAAWSGLPLLMAVLWSLVDPDRPWSYPHLFPPGLSLFHWRHTFRYTGILRAVFTSFVLAASSTLLAFLLALPTAYALGRRQVKSKGLLMLIVLMPVMMPGMTFALFLGRLFNLVGLFKGFPGVMLGHALMGLPYMLRILTISFEAISQEILDAADDLRASRWVKLKEIYFPLILPGFLAASLFTFIGSIEEFNLAYIVGSPNIETITTILFSYLGYHFVRTSSSVVAMILVIPNLLLLFLFERHFKAEYLSAAMGKM